MLTLLAVAAAGPPPAEVPAADPLVLADAGSSETADPVAVLARTQARWSSATLTGDYYLETFINGQPTKKIVRFRYNGAELSASASDLEAIGLALGQAGGDPAREIRLVDLAGVSFQYDMARLQIRLEVEDTARTRQLLSSRARRSALPAASTTTGMLLNYSIFALKDDLTRWNGKALEGVSGSFDARMFSPYGSLSHAFLVATNGGHRRLRTSYTYSDQARLLTINAGDLVSGGLSWTRPINMAGIQIRRDFGLREDLITMPSPTFSGSAAVPSTVDVYLQNSRIFSSGVDAGPYQVTDLPIVTGGDVARVVVRGPQGQETVSTLPFYASAQMLRPGLLDFSLEAGFARRGFGGRNDDYDSSLIASGSARYGLTDEITLVGHAEGGAGVVNAGAGGTVLLGQLGTLSVAGAASEGPDGSGGLANVALEIEPWPDITLFANHQRTFSDYADLASVTAREFRRDLPDDEFLGDFRPAREITQVSLGVPARTLGANFGVAYTGWKAANGESYRTASATYDQRLFERVNLFVTGYAEFGGDGRKGIFAGISISLGGRRNITVGGRADEGGTTGTLAYSKSNGNGIGDAGYSVRIEEGENSYREAFINYRAREARLSGMVRHAGGRLQASAQIDGSVVAAGGGIFLSDRVDDAFAIVKTGLPNVPVLRESRLVGHTNGRGAILVTDLVGFASNRLSIDISDLPVDAAVTDSAKVVVPQARSGVVVDFGVRRAAGTALVAFTDGRGEPIEVGSVVALDGAEIGVIGYDGEAYLTGLQSANEVVISISDGARCHASFDFKPIAGKQIWIRGVQCH